MFHNIITEDVRNKELLNIFFEKEMSVQLNSMKTKIFLIQHIILGVKPYRMSCWILRIQQSALLAFPCPTRSYWKWLYSGK